MQFKWRINNLCEQIHKKKEKLDRPKKKKRRALLQKKKLDRQKLQKVN